MQYTTRYCIIVAMSHKNTIIALTIIVIIIGYWWYVLVWHTLSSAGDTLKVHFLDIGQGDAILLETPNKHQMIIDAGRGIKVLNALDIILPSNDRDLDIVVMTHPDADHIGGFVPILKRYKVDTIIQSFIPSKTNLYKEIVSLMQEEGATTYTISQAYSFTFDGVQFDILWPLSTEVTEKNAASVVLLVSYGNTEILLTGDASAKIEEFLIKSFPEKLNDIEILKAGHHGSKTSTAESFLNHIKPNTIIYSAGKNNSYGHPHDIILNRVKAYAETNPAENLTEHRTAEGTVSFCITPKNYTLCK